MPQWPGGKGTKIGRHSGQPWPIYSGVRVINSPTEQKALSQVLPYSHSSLAAICSALKYCDTNYKNHISSDISLTTKAWGRNLISTVIKIKAGS